MMMRAMVCCLEEDSGPLPVSAKFSLPFLPDLPKRIYLRPIPYANGQVSRGISYIYLIA
ncbi:hypothetical protein CNAG_06805 [Cryptococcus neoformans var. grubii H99]|uniref:Uncharacterized protein n=1 Tax=Cryptococcus neoformans (strain H99 / ATCC 208821 / CBS 10515 / FGSC 9487) TaxID=235443 RepID=J9VPY3_CRYN9|nr:hypothetical protein CNAG_06805 [Cryptococcus neoformans var. grubii H99]AFR94674.1 hypothetical protein CNAG_06805 [Cryptococcus neoformans var. grubii H99]AUB24373.1 hypothetical protein CKF44_06805 [Cryptococcus neoformans var. grubii]|eukprot:XP_012049554.1 hypothetical protein CNAG_06805 [Cryptococcus neoformans var. grubii H99]